MFPMSFKYLNKVGWGVWRRIAPPHTPIPNNVGVAAGPLSISPWLPGVQPAFASDVLDSEMDFLTLHTPGANSCSCVRGSFRVGGRTVRRSPGMPFSVPGALRQGWVNRQGRFITELLVGREFVIVRFSLTDHISNVVLEAALAVDQVGQHILVYTPGTSLSTAK